MTARATGRVLRQVVGVALGLAAAVAAAADGAERPAAERARHILEATGTRGGLVVHLGCGDGALTAALHAGDRYLVHGLDADPANVEKARRHIQSLGVYGPVSVDRLRGRRLPYAENLAGLVVAEDLCGVGMDEVMRVLAPRGVAYVRRGGGAGRRSVGEGGWTKTVKPWPETIDEWTHWLHAADGNAVARDRVVAPPRRLQWVAAPLWARHHDTVPSTTAMVSSHGRLFYISDEAPACVDGSLPDKWFLVARDAFNGALLWKRRMPEWGWRQWNTEWKGRFDMPPQLPKRVVAAGDRLYATLAFNAPLAALDAATGEVLRTYDDTRYTDEILYRDGLLILSLNREARTPSADNRTPVRKAVCVVEANSGRMRWKTGDYVGLRAKYDSSEPFGRLELAAGGDAVFLVDHQAIVCLDLASGNERWRVPRPDMREHLVMYHIRMSDQSVLVYQDGVVLLAQPQMQRKRSWHTLPGTLYAYDAASGKALWQHPYGGWAHNWQSDVFAIDGLVWVHEHVDVPFKGHEPRDKAGIDYAVIGLDLRTGVLKRRFSTKPTFNVGHHHRCYRGKATERFLLASRRGAEFLDLATGHNDLNHWARGACLHGFVPCNGLLYLAPHPCDCYVATKLNGYCALAPASAAADGGAQAPGTGDAAFERGPAYEAVQAEATRDTADQADWPTFRHDALRSGCAKASVGAALRRSWRVAVGGRLSPPVVAGKKLFVASVDGHRVHALAAGDGGKVWSFTAGGRIDTPPTIHKGLALFGAADGWVYCLRAADGRLVWRRRVAPRQRLVGAFNQLESAWPLHGSVLVENGAAYVAAGRSSYLDGGIRLCALDPATGKVLKRETLYSPDPRTGAAPAGTARTLPGVLADILVSDGSAVYMRQQQVFGSEARGRPHLFATGGFRDETWFNRTRWAVGAVAQAQLLVFDDRTAYGISAYPNAARWGFFHPGGKGYVLFARRWTPAAPANAAAGGKPKPGRGRKAAALWSAHVPVRFTALAVAGTTLVAAGTPDVVDPNDPLGALEGRKGGVLWLVATGDGRKVAECRLDSPPVYDGLAVAGGRLYLTTAAGEVICFDGTAE